MEKKLQPCGGVEMENFCIYFFAVRMKLFCFYPLYVLFYRILDMIMHTNIIEKAVD